MSYKKALRVKQYEGDTSFGRLPDFGFRGSLYDFQVRGLFYLKEAKKCILADATGLGKTIQCIALFQWLEHKKKPNKWVLVVPANTIYQWAEAFEEFSSLQAPVLGVGGRRSRMDCYIVSHWWQFYILSYQNLWRDWEMVDELGIKNWVFDDAHFFRHRDTKTAEIIRHLVKGSDRIILATATPKQKSIMNIYSLLEVLGLRHEFGSEIGFENRYAYTRKVRIVLQDGREFWKKEELGTRNPDELYRRLEPYIIKRTFKEVGKELPALIVKPIYLKLSAPQQKIYNQMKTKILQAWDEGKIKTVPNKGFHSMIQICVGTRLVGLEEDSSSKLDAVLQFIDDKLGLDDKVIVYAFYKEAIRTLAKRLKAAGRNDFVCITGDDTKKRKEQVRKAFMQDPKIRILLGTDAIEIGLNLQSARYLLMVNLIYNAQRMIQLIGRLRRLGSKHQTVVVYPLLAKGTIEERLWSHLKFESALTDQLFKEESDAFPKISSVELVSMIRSMNDGR